MSADECPSMTVDRTPVLHLPFAKALMGVLAALFVLFAWITVESLRFPSSVETAEVGAGRFPLISGIGGMVSCAGAFYYAVRRAIRARVGAAVGTPEDTLEIKGPLSIFVAGLLIVGWVEGMSVVGFYTCSLVLVPAILLLGGERRPLWIILFTVGFLVAVYSCFSLLLHIDFP
ncbi:tripartite tricarboxylate transporter TctB family protein [Castellaniella sp.]|uniref:tripartite tricarboxylate transporter TctB family protein n=1 Tax=Castellaniella sp. TaxID=1955812 RepID=UPI003A8F3C01